MTPADLAACFEVIRVHSRSFYAASRLLPSEVRAAAVATYAFCRGADDDVDEADGAQEASRRHRRTRRRLDQIYAGEPLDTPVGRAFQAVVVGASIPVSEPSALLDGMEQDIAVVRIEDEDQLLLYAYRAAGVVGCMMSRIMGRAEPAALRRAIDLGIAMQLTNIARDVGEDAARDRVYLPASWLEEAGSSVEEVLRAEPTPGIRATTLRLLELAERYYDSGIGGIALLPFACRPAILSAALLYRAIGRGVRDRGGDGMSARVRVGGAGKVGRIALALGRVAFDPRLRRPEPASHSAELHRSLGRAGIRV